MATSYYGNPSSAGGVLTTLPSDGDARTAASVNTAFQQLANSAASLYSMQVLNWKGATLSGTGVLNDCEIGFYSADPGRNLRYCAAVGYDSANTLCIVATSIDGERWTRHDTSAWSLEGTSKSYNAVCHSPNKGKWYIGGEKTGSQSTLQWGSFFDSSATWTAHPNSYDVDINAICNTDFKVYVVGDSDGGSGNPLILYSDDGTTFSTISVTAAGQHLYDVTSDNDNTVVAVGGTSAGGKLIVVIDMTAATATTATVPADAVGPLRHVTWNGTYFIAACYSGIIYSTDGVTWSWTRVEYGADIDPATGMTCVTADPESGIILHSEATNTSFTRPAPYGNNVPMHFNLTNDPGTQASWHRGYQFADPSDAEDCVIRKRMAYKHGQFIAVSNGLDIFTSMRRFNGL